MYKSLMKRYRDQNPREVFAHFSYNEAAGETWESSFQRLAAKAQHEEGNWNFTDPEFQRPGQTVPILVSYLDYTFRRLIQQNKINYAASDDRACLNTGLQTPEGKDIYATFFKNKEAVTRNQPDWSLYGYFDAYSDKVRDFEPLPDIATYVNEPAELVFDHNFEIDIDYKHIIGDNKDRLPEPLRESDKLARHAIEGAIKELRERLRRNYKLAVPHWYDDKVQLLLPLAITDDSKADFALVADKDKDRRKYLVRTILTLDQAYIDARLITAPDRAWLNP